MYIAVSLREEYLILEALAKLLITKNTRIKPRLITRVDGKITTSLHLKSFDDATVKENFEYFCKILGLRQEKLKFFEYGVGNSAIFVLTHDVIRVYAVQNLGKDSAVREFEKRVRSVYPMTSKVKDYVYESSTIDCTSVEIFLDSLEVPFKILTKSEFFAEILFKSISISIASISGSKPSKLLLQYSSV